MSARRITYYTLHKFGLQKDVLTILIREKIKDGVRPMAYSFMSISKIKTMGSMVSKYNHNYRKADVTNANPELAHLNEELIPLPKNEDGTEMRYDEAFRERISGLPYYKDHKIRKDQVQAYEVLLTFSRDESIDTEQWKKQSMEWLHQTFDKAEDGKSNVLGAVYHADETGNVHIHAFVVPIDERGHLCAKRFTNGSRQLSNLQTSYADAVKDLGLERGLYGSTAKHQVIRKMYADLNNAIKIDDPMEGETAAEYKARIIDQAETLYATRKKAADDYMVSARRKTDEYTMRQKNEITEEIERVKLLYSSDIQSLKGEKKKLDKQRDQAKEELSAYQAQVDELAQQMYELKTSLKITEDDHIKAVKASRIEAGIEIIRTEDPERADRLQNDIEYAIQRAEAREATLHLEEPNESL